MKKYLRYSCTVCKRSADQLVDNARFTPDKCTITFKCQGRLIPVEYRANGAITPAPEVGISDWRARGSVITSNTGLAEQTLIDTSTGVTKQIVLALRIPDLGPGSTAVLTLKQRVDTPKNYRQYTYRFEGSFSSISGVEAGLEKKALRYSLTDTVEVFLNGVKLEQGTAPENFTIYDGTPSSSVLPNIVNLNQTISLPGITQVDVIVSAAVVSTDILLTFNRNVYDESRVTTGSWENVQTVRRFNGSTWREFQLYTLDLGDAGALKLNTILTNAGEVVVDGSTFVQPENAYILLARKPYSTLDRYTNLAVPLDTLSFDRDYLKYSVLDGESVLRVTSTSVEPIFPILQIQKFKVEKTIQTSVPGVSNQVIIDGSVIVGPDV